MTYSEPRVRHRELGLTVGWDDDHTKTDRQTAPAPRFTDTYDGGDAIRHAPASKWDTYSYGPPSDTRQQSGGGKGGGGADADARDPSLMSAYAYDTYDIVRQIDQSTISSAAREEERRHYDDECTAADSYLVQQNYHLIRSIGIVPQYIRRAYLVYDIHFAPCRYNCSSSATPTPTPTPRQRSSAAPPRGPPSTSRRCSRWRRATVAALYPPACWSRTSGLSARIASG